LVFGAVRLRVWGTKSEQVSSAKFFDTKTVTAVLRPLPRNQVAILLSAEVKNWLISQLEEMHDTLPNEVADISRQVVGWIKADNDLRLLCKQLPSGVLQLGVMQLKEEKGKLVKAPSWQSKLAIDLGAVVVFPAAVTPAQGPRLLIELDPIA